MSDKMKVRDGNDGYSYPYTSPDIVIDENGKSVSTKFNEINTQFKDIANKIMKINIKYPPIPFVGAKGDSVTDDTTVINSIIDNCNDGDIIYFPKGIYIISDEINIKNGIEIIGSEDSTIKKIAKVNYSSFKLGGRNKISKLNFQNEYTTSGTEDDFINICDLWCNGDDIIIEYCNFGASKGSSICGTGVNNIRILNNNFDEFDDHNIYFSSSNKETNNIIISNNIFINSKSTRQVIKLKNMIDNIIISNNIFKSNSELIILENIHNAIINSNIGECLSFIRTLNRKDTMTKSININNNNITSTSYLFLIGGWGDELGSYINYLKINNNIFNGKKMGVINGGDSGIQVLELSNNSINLEDVIILYNNIININFINNIIYSETCNSVFYIKTSSGDYNGNLFKLENNGLKGNIKQLITEYPTEDNKNKSYVIWDIICNNNTNELAEFTPVLINGNYKNDITRTLIYKDNMNKNKQFVSSYSFNTNNFLNYNSKQIIYLKSSINIGTIEAKTCKRFIINDTQNYLKTQECIVTVNPLDFSSALNMSYFIRYDYSLIIDIYNMSNSIYTKEDDLSLFIQIEF